jgi:hypothetical protein
MKRVLRRIGRTEIWLTSAAVLAAICPALAGDEPACVWSGWQQMPGDGRIDGAPTLLNYSGRRELYALVRGIDGSLWMNVRRIATWGDWVQIPGEPSTAEPAAILDLGGVHVAVRGALGALMTNTFTPWPATWFGWSEVPGGMRIVGAPAIVASTSPFEGPVYYVTGEDNRVYKNSQGCEYFGPCGWVGWQEVPGDVVFASGPAATLTPDGFTVLAARGTNDRVYVNIGLSGWSPVYGMWTTARPAVTYSPLDHRLHVFARDFDNTVRHAHQKDDGTWSTAEPLPDLFATAAVHAVMVGNSMYVATKGLCDAIVLDRCDEPLPPG